MLNKDMLNETPNLIPEKTGLPIKIWIDNSDTAKNHSKYYVKIYPKRPHTVQGDGIEMTIDPNPTFPKTQPDLHRLNITSHELECVKRWVGDNWENLRKICENKLDFQAFLKARHNPDSEIKHVQPKTKIQVRLMKDVSSGPNAPVVGMKESYSSIDEFITDWYKEMP